MTGSTSLRCCKNNGSIQLTSLEIEIALYRWTTAALGTAFTLQFNHDEILEYFYPTQDRSCIRNLFPRNTY
jgi:hypothetical protein